MKSNRNQKEWDRFKTKFSGVFYASVFAVILGAVVTLITRWCSS